MAQIIDGKYIIELDEQTSIALTAWLPFQPNAVPNQAFRISLENFIKALPIIPAVAGEYDDIAELLTEQPGQTVDVFYKVADPSDDPDYNDLKDSEIKSVYYHLVDVKTGSLSNYNSIAIPKLESSKFPKLGNSLEALTFDVKFRSAEWSSNKATLQAISNALKISSPQDLLLDALSLKINTDNNPTDISRVLFGLDGQLIFEPINSAKIQSDSDVGDVTLNDAYQLLLTITGNQNIANGLANIGLTAKSFSTGAIASFNPSGNNRVRANSPAHGFSEGDYVTIVNEPLYNGIVEIKAVPNINDFDFTHSYDGAGSGDWEKSENREIAVDLRVNAISVKEFTRQIEGEGRLNFSEQVTGLVNGEDITVYVKSNTTGEAIEILGTSQSSELKVVGFENVSNKLDKLSAADQTVVSKVAFGLATPLQRIHIKTYNADTDAVIGNFSHDYYGIAVESEDAVIGLISENEGGHGSGIDLMEVNSGTLADKWWIGRFSSGSGSRLIMTFGTNADYATNEVIYNLLTTGIVTYPKTTTQMGLGTTTLNTLHLVFGASGGSGKIGTEADNKRIQITGGTNVSVSNSGYINIMGNSFTDQEGDIAIFAGNSGVSGHGMIQFFTGAGISRLIIDKEGGATFKGQATVEGFETTESATIAINFTTGTNNQEVNITGNISSFTTLNEKAAGNYDAWLVNDGSVRTVVAPTGWTLIPGGDTHDTAANAINLYQFKVSPSGIKRYIIKNM